jgi:D-beta-D-heptose 7-phosphate kinase/D-beta-D-heptose 1-phosphate adenosyltransferase
MNRRPELTGVIGRLAEVSVLCIGDVMLDRYVYGSVDRISPEAPIPILRIEREAAMLGGAGNVVRNLVALGARAAFVSVVGNDSAGREISELITGIAGVEPYFTVERGRETTIKTRYVAAGQQLLRADRETVAAVASSVGEDLRRLAVNAIDDARVVVVSDYGKGVVTPELTSALIKAGRGAHKPIIVDPKGRDFSRYRGATVMTPNRLELAAATAMAVGTDAEIIAAARRLITQCMLDWVLVTRGADGMTLVDREGAAIHLPTEAREVFDVSGAGDTVVAMLAASIGAGASVEDAARLANTAASIVVGKVGTAVASAAEIVAALHAQEFLSGEAKVMSHADAITRIAEWRHEGLKIGFTNGVFDLLHPGHLSLVTQAKAACDRLVVGLNSDASVTRLKGPTRPIQNEASRAAVLASLAAIDLVVIFIDDTPIRLIEDIRPDVLVKGADYTRAQVVGAEVVEKYGGRVLLADLVPGQSTSRTIAKLARDRS